MNEEFKLSDKIRKLGSLAGATYGTEIFYPEDVKEFIRRLKEDEIYFYRTCHKCGRVWGSLHCPHDGVQGTCPDCKTRALSFFNKECNCEFMMEVDKIDKLSGLNDDFPITAGDIGNGGID